MAFEKRHNITTEKQECEDVIATLVSNEAEINVFPCLIQ